MSVDEVTAALGTVELRELLLLHMAIFSGFRSGEMLGLQRRHVSDDATVVKVEQRLYRGDIDNPKTNPSRREAAVPPGRTAVQVDELSRRTGAGIIRFRRPARGGKPIWRDTLLYCTITSVRGSNLSGWNGWTFR
jgi:hypothetical protein